MTISVRTASAADVDVIVRLNRDVQQLHAKIEPSFFKSGTESETVAAFFAAKVALPPNHFRLASGSDDPAGYIWFEVQKRPETPLTLAMTRIYIHHLSVLPNARRKGVASALLRYVETEAIAKGIRNIALGTWAANTQALGFFNACGFKTSSLVLSKQLA